MTESEWLACRQPQPMLAFVSGRVGPRKLHLFACACVRRVWHLLNDPRSRLAVEVTEQRADGAATAAELYGAWVAANHAFNDARGAARDAARAAARVARWQPRNTSPTPLGSGNDRNIPVLAATLAAASAAGWNPTAVFGRDDPRLAVQAALLRDVVNPFHRDGPDPEWLTWDGGVVVRLARVAYQERHLPDGTLDNDRLAVLADALEEAGCDDARILGHLRGGEEHCRGCFAVDLLLGKR